MSSFFFNDPATTEIYTLSLHDALPILLTDGASVRQRLLAVGAERIDIDATTAGKATIDGDRKSTRLNSSHDQISYAVFCLKKKNLILKKNNRREK